MSSPLDPRWWLGAPAGAQRLGQSVGDLLGAFEKLTKGIDDNNAETSHLRSVAEDLRSELRQTRFDVEGLREDIREIRDKVPGL